MHFHLTRRNLLNHIVERYGLRLEEAQRVADYLESSGEVAFTGGMFIVNNPTAADSLMIQTLARGALGTGLGGAVSYYKARSWLDDTLRVSRSYALNRSLTSAG